MAERSENFKLYTRHAPSYIAIDYYVKLWKVWAQESFEK